MAAVGGPGGAGVPDCSLGGPGGPEGPGGPGGPGGPADAGGTVEEVAGVGATGGGEVDAVLSITTEFGLVGGFLETSGGFTVVCFTTTPEGCRAPAESSAGGLFAAEVLPL